MMQEIIAYETGSQVPFHLERATQSRDWMDRTAARFAYRCLPMLIANQSMWHIVTEKPFSVQWDGGMGISSIHIEGDVSGAVQSHFGHGIVTFSLPWLFRTPSGYDLLLRGPANMPKYGISPLEGVVETYWAVATATMNWQCTRRDYTIWWGEGEPIAAVQPVQHAGIEEFTLSLASLHDNKALQEQYQAWAASRSQFNASLEDGTYEQLWEKDYMRGTSPGGMSAPAGTHKTKLK